MGAELIGSLPAGDAGTFTTLRIMAQMIRRPAPSVVEFAGRVAGGRSQAEAAAALFYFVRDQVRNEPDPPGIEWLQAPHVTLRHPVGDCDDKTTLLGALLQAVGVKVRLVAIGIRSQRLGHVYLEALLPTPVPHWLPLDPKNPNAFPGWAWPQPVRRQVLEV